MGVEIRSGAKSEVVVYHNFAFTKEALQVGIVRRLRSNLPIEK
jgi:hypothetical protein